jgi:hypothetical protein
MLGDILGEVLSSIVGDILFEGFFPNRKLSASPPTESKWTAFWGIAAALLAGLGTILWGVTAVRFAQSRPSEFPFPIFSFAFIPSLAAGMLARRSLRRNCRYRTLGAAALWVARFTIAATFVTLVWWFYRCWVLPNKPLQRS